MNQQPHQLAQQQPPYPQKMPHLYSGQVLTALVTLYIVSFILVGVGSTATNSPNQSSEPAFFFVLSSIGAVLLLVIHGFILLVDGRNFFTLNERIHWQHLKGWLRLGLIVVYLCFWIMPAIYLTFAITHFVGVKQQTKTPKGQIGAEYRMNQQAPWLPQVDVVPPPRMSLRRVFKLFLYFIGVILAEFGLLGAALSAANSNSILANEVGGATCFVGLLALVGSIFIFFRWRFHVYSLRWLHYLVGILLITIGAIMALVLELALIPNSNDKPLPEVILGCIVFLYGVALIAIAYLKPPLRQQVDESVRRILETLPGQQISLAELIACLQTRYHCSDVTLYQYIANLQYIERVNIPGTPVIVCRMKAPKHAVVVPQMAPNPVSPFQPWTASVTPSAQVPAQKVIVPPSVQTPPPTSLRPKEAFASLPDQSTVPALPIPRPNQVPPSPPVQSAMPSNSKPEGVLVPPSSQSVAPATFQPNDPKPSSSLEKEQKAIKIFCCYSHKDAQLLDKLKTHLRPLQRQGLIDVWYDRDISAGAEWESEISQHLNSAQIILLLVSPDFMNSDYCYSTEMKRAIERHKRREACVIPISLRPVDWEGTPISTLQMLPPDGKPITKWSNRDEAFKSIAQGIRTVVETFLTPPQQPKEQVHAPSGHQQMGAEVELIRTRCKQGKLIVTNKRIVVELSSVGHVLNSQMLLRSALTGIESKLAVPAVFGMGGGVNLVFHGRGRELLNADLVPPKEAKEIIALLS